MQPKVFVNQLDDRQIVQAIADAERNSSGEIRVYISEKQVENVVEEAKVHFLRLGMQKTRERNGVMIYIAPRSRNFAVVGDAGIHEKCGESLWTEVAAIMELHLKADRYTEAILAAVAKVGSILAIQFPRRPDDVNELPDDIAGD